MKTKIEVLRFLREDLEAKERWTYLGALYDAGIPNDLIETMIEEKLVQRCGCGCRGVMITPEGNTLLNAKTIPSVVDGLLFKGTPGPWFRDGVEVGVGILLDIKIAKVSGLNYDEAKLNARLIEAAPELLSVLQQALPHIREAAKSDGHAFGTLQLANRIIRQATGE